MTVLVLHGGALGDCVLAIHLLRAWRATCPRVRCTLAARSSIGKWAATHGLIEATTSLDRTSVYRLHPIDEDSRPPESVRLDEFDLVVSFVPLPGHIERRWPGLIVRLEPRKLDPGSKPLHITQRWAETLSNRGVQIHEDHLLHPTTGIMATGARTALLRRLQAPRTSSPESSPVALIHPGSGGLSKCCPIAALTRLAIQLRERGWNVAWMIGPDEVERWGGHWGDKLEPNGCILVEHAVEAAADLITGADLYVGNDAGMTHVAALAGVPTIAIFGPTDPRVWRPIGRACITVPFPTPDAEPDTWVQTVAEHMSRIRIA